MPFQTNEETLLHGHETWSSTFDANKLHISKIEKIFMPHVNDQWGDINQATTETELDNRPLIDLEQDKPLDEIEKYDIMADLKHAKYSIPIEGTCKSQFHEIAPPFFLTNEKY